MNRFLIYVGITLLASVNSQAQSFSIGVKAGADMHKLDGQSFSDNFSFGYHAGVFARIGITPKLGIQPEVLFSQVNVDTSDRFSDIYRFRSLSQVKLQYLRIPILLDYKIVPALSLQAGPHFAVLMDQNLNLVQNGKKAFSRHDVGLLAGVQVRLSKLRIYGRYILGVSNMNDIDDKERWNNQTVQLGVGLAF